MPRHNRNAHAPIIDVDKLADQISQLRIELGCFNGVMICLADETQVYFAAAAQGTGKSSVLRTYLTEWLSAHPGGKIRFADAKAVTSDAR